MAKAKVKLELKGLTNPEAILKSRTIATASTGKPLATGGPATPAQINTAAGNLEAKGEEIRLHDLAGKALTGQQSTLRGTLDGLVTDFAGHIESGSLGVEATIREYGLDVQSPTTTPIGPLGQVLNFSVSEGDNPGDLDAHWDRKKGAKSYLIEKTTDPNNPASWTPCAPSTKSSTTVKNLTSGTKYWLRVAAFGAAGQGPWSDPATKIAP